MKKYKSIYNTPEYRKRYTGIYGSWYAMKQRCGNANNHQYKDYGGRGIGYQESWKEFANFNKDMSENYKKGLTIDRIDNNGSYSKENCRWVTRKTQNRNKRTNAVLTCDGRTLTLADWADELKLNFGTLRSRFYRGMNPVEILRPTLYRPAKKI